MKKLRMVIALPFAVIGGVFSGISSFIVNGDIMAFSMLRGIWIAVKHMFDKDPKSGQKELCQSLGVNKDNFDEHKGIFPFRNPWT
jgi:hypothetical protein